MPHAIRYACATAAAAAGLGLFAVPSAGASLAPATTQTANRGDVHALFVQTDQTTGNRVAVYSEGSDGTLALAHTYATGGAGGILPTSVIDHTASQGAVTYDPSHQLLYVVNAGSDTVSVFSVDGTQLTLQQVIRSGGTFPVSVAVHEGVVYVLNAQNGGSIQGYRVHGKNLDLVPTWNRPLGLDPTLTVFTETPGQVAFTPDGRFLLVTTKANTNSIDVFPLDDRGAITGPVVHNVRPGAVPFALAFGPQDEVVSADAGTAAVTTLRLNQNGTLTDLATVATGQKGTCWVIRDGSHLFTTNPGAPSVTSLALNPGATPTVLGSVTTDPGTVDPALSANGRVLYVETGAKGIVDAFSIGTDGLLSQIGSVTVANAAGAEGMASS